MCEITQYSLSIELRELVYNNYNTLGGLQSDGLLTVTQYMARDPPTCTTWTPSFVFFLSPFGSMLNQLNIAIRKHQQSMRAIVECVRYLLGLV